MTGIDELMKVVADIARRLDILEVRSALQLQEKASGLAEAADTSPLSRVPTSPARHIGASVQEFKLTRRAEDVKCVEFDRDAGKIRVVYRGT